jgi:hypothetical protein
MIDVFSGLAGFEIRLPKTTALAPAGETQAQLRHPS